MDKDEVEKQNKIEITIDNEIKLDLSPNIRDSNEWNIWVKKKRIIIVLYSHLSYKKLKKLNLTQGNYNK